jgi:7-cyano-7-deazaguanine reductase
VWQKSEKRPASRCENRNCIFFSNEGVVEISDQIYDQALACARSISFDDFLLPGKLSSMSDPSRDLLETFENPFPQRNFLIETIAPEFTSMCPKTGQPDFGTLTITYIADKVCYELKSLKLYLQQYRNHGAFYERVTNMILDDLVAVTHPRWIKIEAAFTPRGGIRTTVIVEHGKRPE